MDRKSFRESLKNKTPPTGIDLALQALWHAANGDWTKAHECAQEQDDKRGAWVHAHLHRQEGDLGNAGYWYRKAGKPMSTQPLPEEWNTIVDALLPEPG
jgi:hypothetical protein